MLFRKLPPMIFGGFAAAPYRFMVGLAISKRFAIGDIFGGKAA